MAELERLDIRDRKRWRKWLARNHASSPGVWLIVHKSHTGVPSLTYGDILGEALCFGWIDSLVKRLDEDRYLRKVTPRRSDSKWSDINRRQWAELKDAGLLAPPGLAAAPTDNRYAPVPSVPKTVPQYIVKALKLNRKAWTFFQQLAPTDRRHFVMWIHLAKRPETREKRLRESMALLSAGKKLGLK